ncbi:hypothetical protein [Mesorhizobium sp. IMUNJ 23232]|uniref:hypothetical protein n=1 Tax=Mesorhizobium sp. IMUNJ 23232 TaxID=3376064 RepID=UPI003794ADAB
MRLKIAILAFLTAMTGGAHASSFAYVAPPPAGKSPSVIEIGLPKLASVATQPDVVPAQPDPRGDVLVPLAYPLPDAQAAQAKYFVVSPSVVAFEAIVPPVTFEKVAAIDRPHPAPQPKPLVIRGGIVGDAFTERAEPIMLPQATSNDGKPGSARQRKRENRREREAPQQPAPPAPAPAMSARQFAVPG